MNYKNIPNLKIDIRNQANDVAEIDIYGEIGWVNEHGDWNTALSIKTKLGEIANMDVKKIVVNINSLGGFVDDGLAIHDVLASHKAKIETRVIGMTASAATVIAQAGDVRHMSENALYLIHHSWGRAIGNAMDMMEAAADMEAIDSRLVNIYTKRSGKDVDEIRELLGANNGSGKWITADQAKEYGLIDEVFEPMKVAASVPRMLLSQMGYPDPDPVGVDEEIIEESQKETINGLRSQMRIIQNRKAKNNK